MSTPQERSGKARKKSSPVSEPEIENSEGPAIVDRHGDIDRIREDVDGAKGYVALGCGCYIKIDSKSLKQMPSATILDAICQSAGTCKHDRQH